MNKEKLFKEVAEYLAGSCESVDGAFELVCKYSEPPIEVPDQEVIDEFEEYLENIDMYCCENCGWWQYPGEGYRECECETEDDEDDED